MIKEGNKRTKWKGSIMPEHRVVHAFTCAGIKFFNFDDTFSMPSERALDALTIFEEMNMRCTREFLLAHTAAVNKLLLSNPINVFEIKKLTDQLDERLKFVVYPKLIKKLASVYYFDQTENPYKYDSKYAEEKIALWDKENLEDFFLSIPISKLIPSYSLSGIDLATYSQITEKMDQAHLVSLFSNLSPDQRNSNLFGQLFSTLNTQKTAV